MLASDTPSKARNELGFIKAVVAPLYRTLADVSPPLRACLALIDANCAQWESGRRSSRSQHSARFACCAVGNFVSSSIYPWPLHAGLLLKRLPCCVF
jgi:hypothetical protein